MGTILISGDTHQRETYEKNIGKSPEGVII